MIIFPAIDLYDKKAVRLYKGDYSQMTVYSDNPVEIAKDFEEKGAKYRCGTIIGFTFSVTCLLLIPNQKLSTVLLVFACVLGLAILLSRPKREENV